MSFMNEFERERIYDEMDKSQSKSKTGIFSKLLGTALFLSIGFASGSIYSTFHNNPAPTIPENTLPVNTTTITSLNTTPTPQVTTSNSLANVVNAVADSVVEITQYSAQSLSPYSSSGGNGSGVIISNDGYILTNNHVIVGADKISVRLRNGTEYDATLVGKDAKTDMAIIKVEATDLKAATIGNSTSTQVGDFVLAIGNPLGKLGGTVTYGFVSALEREITIDNMTMNLMQFDAAVNPGRGSCARMDESGNDCRFYRRERKYTGTVCRQYGNLCGGRSRRNTWCCLRNAGSGVTVFFDYFGNCKMF